ncbi:MAG: hypothetical protein GKR92_05990 [Gammaproteobacteria bacterium]|nr:MAG: hypothetical protein GKR92_05990 [Gammaproteobacteria bacterium]
MLPKFLVCISFAVTLLLTACGDDGGSASGKWVGEVYASSNSKTSTVVGEFGSYSDCLEATQKESKSGIFNCGVKN